MCLFAGQPCQSVHRVGIIHHTRCGRMVGGDCIAGGNGSESWLE